MAQSRVHVLLLKSFLYRPTRGVYRCSLWSTYLPVPSSNRVNTCSPRAAVASLLHRRSHWRLGWSKATVAGVVGGFRFHKRCVDGGCVLSQTQICKNSRDQRTDAVHKNSRTSKRTRFWTCLNETSLSHHDIALNPLLVMLIQQTTNNMMMQPWLSVVKLRVIHTDARYWCRNSVCPSVCLSVRNIPVSDENGVTYRHSFFTIR